MPDLTIDQLNAVWNSGDGTRAAMDKRRRYYKGQHKITELQEQYADGTQKSQRVTNWVKYIVKRYVGALTSTAWQVTREDEKADSEGVDSYSEIAKAQKFNALDIENLRNALIYGYAIEVHSFDANATDGGIRVTNYKPHEWHLEYDSDEVLSLAIRRVTLDAGTFHKGKYNDEELHIMTVYDASTIITYHKVKAADGKEEWVRQGEPQTHQYGRIPVVVWGTNETRDSLISDALMGQNDEWNSIDSASGDAIRQEVDALLKLYGFGTEWIKENIELIRQLKVLPLKDKATTDAEYLIKPSNVERVQAKMERTRNNIHTMGEVPDVGEIVGASGATSGIALKLMFTPMQEASSEIITYMSQGVRDRIELINAMQSKTRKAVIENYNVILQFAIPVNEIEQWKTIPSLTGIVSHRKQLELLDSVENPERELRALEEEQKKTADIALIGALPEDRAEAIDRKAEELKPMVGDLIEGLSSAVTDFMVSEGILESLAKRAAAAKE